MMSTETMAPTPTAPTAPRSAYARLWLRVPRELGYLLPILPIAITSIAVLTPVFFAGVGWSFLFFGLFVVLAALFIARGFGMFELLRLRASGFPPITAPAWDRQARGSGTLAKLLAPLVDGHYWLYLLWAMFVGPIVGFITWSIAFGWAVTALAGLTFPLYAWALPAGSVHVSAFGFADHGATANVWAIVLTGLLGVVAALTLPFVTRGLTAVHWGLARGMLGKFRAESLEQQVAAVSSSRTAAVAAEGTALRRLERDIHDGPQQRLVRLQMDLAAADRQLAENPDAARTLIAEAMQQSKDALEELRALSRGFAPPILLDRGLVAALESLAARGTLPTTVRAELPAGTALPPELERNAYFIAAEAVANAAKHSGATAVTVEVGLRRVPDTDDTWLDLVVRDDGSGGANSVPGHGIAGLEKRVHGQGGILTVVSPAGGPTVVTANLPVTGALPGSV